MKNICFLNSSRFWGGGEKLHLENALEFRAMGYTVFIAAHPNSELWQRAQHAQFKTIPVQLGSLSFLNILKLFKLKKALSKAYIDTLIFTTSQDFKAGSLAGYISNISRIVYLRGLAVPIKNSWINRFGMQRACTHIIANSEETKRTMLQYLKRSLPENRIHTIYHGIQPQLLDKKSASLPQILKQGRGIILGNAGRLTPQKGQEHLLKVARYLKEEKVPFTLFIAGTGELHDTLKHEILKYNLTDEVILLGFVEDMEAFMHSIDIFLLPSAWEGFGFAMVEAMAKRKPVVAFDITSNPEIIAQNQTGLLAEYPNIQDFASKTLQLINNETQRQEMGEAAQQSVQNRFLLPDRAAEIAAYISK